MGAFWYIIATGKAASLLVQQERDMRTFLLALALLLTCQEALAQTKPFAMEEVSVRGGVQYKWDAVLEAIELQRDDPKLLAFKKQFEGLEGRKLLGHVNRAVNQGIRVRSDGEKWGQDHWSTALETLLSAEGDCEDKQILKYEILRFFLPAEKLRPVVGWDKKRQEGHMILLAWVDNQWLTLDNNTLTLVEHSLLSPHFIPHFILGEGGTFRLIGPYNQAQVR